MAYSHDDVEAYLLENHKEVSWPPESSRRLESDLPRTRLAPSHIRCCFYTFQYASASQSAGLMWSASGKEVFDWKLSQMGHGANKQAYMLSDGPLRNKIVIKAHLDKPNSYENWHEDLRGYYYTIKSIRAWNDTRKHTRDIAPVVLYIADRYGLAIVFDSTVDGIVAGDVLWMEECVTTKNVQQTDFVNFVDSRAVTAPAAMQEEFAKREDAASRVLGTFHSDLNNAMHKFSHYSFDDSNGEWIICDLQGSGNNNFAVLTFTVTDPLCYEMASDRGKIEQWFESHSCDKCECLSTWITPTNLVRPASPEDDEKAQSEDLRRVWVSEPCGMSPEGGNPFDERLPGLAPLRAITFAYVMSNGKHPIITTMAYVGTDGAVEKKSVVIGNAAIADLDAVSTTIELDADEFVNECDVYYGGFLNTVKTLVFRTNRGRQLEYGERRSYSLQMQSVRPPHPNYALCGFHGRAGWFIDMIGFVFSVDE